MVRCEAKERGNSELTAERKCSPRAEIPSREPANLGEGEPTIGSQICAITKYVQDCTECNFWIWIAPGYSVIFSFPQCTNNTQRKLGINFLTLLQASP
jgi:hypothetical protein